MMAALCFAMVFLQALLRERLMEELFWAALFAACLSTLALITCPLIVSGILKPRMRLSHVVHAAVFATIHGIALAWGSALMFPLPGPGGAAANIVGITILLGLTSVGFVIAGAILWRTIGYRLHSGRLEAEI